MIDRRPAWPQPDHGTFEIPTHVEESLQRKAAGIVSSLEPGEYPDKQLGPIVDMFSPPRVIFDRVTRYIGEEMARRDFGLAGEGNGIPDAQKEELEQRAREHTARVREQATSDPRLKQVLGHNQHGG